MLFAIFLVGINEIWTLPLETSSTQKNENRNLGFIGALDTAAVYVHKKQCRNSRAVNARQRNFQFDGTGATDLLPL